MRINRLFIYLFFFFEGYFIRQGVRISDKVMKSNADQDLELTTLLVYSIPERWRHRYLFEGSNPILYLGKSDRKRSFYVKSDTF